MENRPKSSKSISEQSTPSSSTSIKSQKNPKPKKGESELWQSSITFTDSSVEFVDNKNKKDASIKFKSGVGPKSSNSSSAGGPSLSQRRKSEIIKKSSEQLAKLKPILIKSGTESNVKSANQSKTAIVFNKSMLSGTSSSRGSKVGTGSRNISRPSSSSSNSSRPRSRSTSIPPSTMHSRTRLPGNNNNRPSQVVVPLPIEIPDTVADPEGFQRYLSRRRAAIFVDITDEDDNGSSTPRLPQRLSQTSLDSHFSDF